VEGWKSNNQSLSWEFRTTAPADFKLIIKYLAPAESAGGKYVLSLDEQNFEHDVLTEAKSTTVITSASGTVSLKPGMHKLTISPVAFGKSELMKLLEVQLIADPGTVSK
jgi:alpha-L-fucosidase